MIESGIININKAQNMTSHDVVAIMRKKLGIKRIGHTGTLDPMATGVLPICIGKATRIMEYLDMDLKRYLCTMELGVVTDTCDIWGEVIAKRDAHHITPEDIRCSFDGFTGLIDQTPPMYSAIKVNGKKLYEYARKGMTVDVKARKVYIADLTIIDIGVEESKTVTFAITCTKGTYIRSICRDVGEILGCGGAMSALERVGSGEFPVDKALPIEDVKEMDTEELEKHILPLDCALIHFGRVRADAEAAKKFITGWHLPLSLCEVEKEPEFAQKDFYIPINERFKRAYNVYGNIDGQERFLGVACFDRQYGKLVADKVFYTGRKRK